VTVTAGATRAATAFLAPSVWVNRAAMAMATSATAAAKINMTRRGVSHGARAAATALTGASPRSPHEMLN
jgi:hypothetical protein